MNKKEFLKAYKELTPDELYDKVTAFEVEIYDEYDGRMKEMKEYFIDKVDEYLENETQTEEEKQNKKEGVRDLVCGKRTNEELLKNIKL